MGYNFPASPTEGQKFTGTDGREYVWHSPSWYLFTEEGLTVVNWNDIVGKPATFPPTVPINWSNITGQPAAYPPIVPINWTDVSGKPLTFPPTVPINWSNITGQPATYPPTVPINWSNITGQPATYPPTLPIAQTGVTNLTTDLAAKAPLASPALTGNPTAPTPTAGDNDTSIATTQFVTTAVSGKLDTATAATTYAPLASPVLTGDPRAPTPATSDNDTSLATTAYVKANLAAMTSGATISDTAPSSPTVGQLWFESDSGRTYVWYTDANSSQWVQIAPGGVTATAQTYNRIVNGAMIVSQENSTILLSTAGQYPADQWYMTFGGVGSTSTWTYQNVSLGVGESNRIRAICTTAQTSLSAATYVGIGQIIEGIRIYDFGWGTAKAKQVVLRFKWKSPAGTFSVSLNKLDGARSFVREFTISAGQANTETLQTVIVPAETTAGTWPSDASAGLYLYFNIAVGSTYNGGVSGWQNGDKYGVTLSNGAATVGNTFEVGEVGFYLDPNNTGFPPEWVIPDYATELRACQRYWQYYPTMVVDVGSYAQTFVYQAPMRVTPSVTGGGAGFSISYHYFTHGTFVQTSRNWQSLILNARL